MNIENLVNMANQIGEFYEAMPDRQQALADIADHIRKFWEPRMRRDLLAYLDGAATCDMQLSPIVGESLSRHIDRLRS